MIEEEIEHFSHIHYVSCRETLPSENEVVMTKIDDHNGVRNERPLKRRGDLWFFPDGSMYVYYTPTHWRRLS